MNTKPVPSASKRAEIPAFSKGRLSYFILSLVYFVGFFLLYYITSSNCLDDYDSINLALGITDYNLSIDQPHPPGAPIFIFFANLLVQLGLSEIDSLVILSAFGGGLFVAVWFRIFTRFFGLPVAIVASLCLGLLPGIWLTANKPMSDSFAAGLLALQLCFSIGAVTERAHCMRRNFYAAIIGAICIGARPQLAPVVLTILITPLVLNKTPFKLYVRLLPVFGITCLAWLIPTIYSQATLDSPNASFFTYLEQIERQSEQLRNMPSWSLFGADVTFDHALKRLIMHLGALFYLSLGLNLWYPQEVNLLLARLGTESTPWNDAIQEWSYAGSLFLVFFVIGTVKYVSSLRWHKVTEKKTFWLSTIPWAVICFLMAFLLAPPYFRIHFPLLPLFILPCILGWAKFRNRRIGYVFMIGLLLLNSLPLALENHQRFAPSVEMTNYLSNKYDKTDHQNVSLILDSNAHRHAEWYGKSFNLINSHNTVLTEQTLSELLSHGPIFTNDEAVIEGKGFPYRLEKIREFQRSIRIWMRHNKITLYKVSGLSTASG